MSGGDPRASRVWASAMITRELLGTAQVPGGEELRLFRHGRDFMIVLGHNELMSTRMRGSEEALAAMTLARLTAPAPHLLIGGYGMGFTLRAALAARHRRHGGGAGAGDERMGARADGRADRRLP